MAAPVLAAAGVTAAMGLMVVVAAAAAATAATAAPMAEAEAPATAPATCELAVLAVCTGEMEETPGKMEAPEQIRAGSGLNSRERGRADRVTPLAMVVVVAAGDTAVMAAVPAVAAVAVAEATEAAAVAAAPAAAVAEATVATAVTAATALVPLVAAAGDTGHAGMAAPHGRQAGLPREGLVLQVPPFLADRASLSSNTTHKEAP
jgi:hypothetical protein